MNISQLSVEDALRSLNSHVKGLDHSEVALRMAKYGLNEIPEKERISPLKIFFRQFVDFMIIILILAAIISGYIGDIADTLIIIIIVLLNAILGFYQEYKAEKAIEALKKMASLHCNVIRENILQTIAAKDLVPGDIVSIEAGNSIPADMRLLEIFSLKIDESTLTGESIPVEKTTMALENPDASIGDLNNMVFKGTIATYGRAIGLVHSTGSHTELGKIASMLQVSESSTPLQVRMADFSKKLSYIILGICLIIFLVGYLRGENPMNMLLLSISLAVAAIPEALPALITVALARGSARMVKKQVLIRKLPAVETLGSVSFICSDKTGTLTENKMSVTETFHIENDILQLPLFQIAVALNNDVVISNQGHIGDPTEIALAEYLIQNAIPNFYTDQRSIYPRVAEVPFDSERKCMTTIHRCPSGFLIITKGAPEVLFSQLADSIKMDNYQSRAEDWAAKGWRVIMYSYKFMPSLPEKMSEVESNLLFLGFAGLIDPPREEVKAAIKECKTAGITPVMITGDHPATALTIAKEIGIWHEKSIAVTGAELKKMDLEVFAENVENISVYARVSPEQKLTIVKALQANGHFVSMTGDGVNDAPALKIANIGVAMGISGTDVSKDAADMILLDDNFTSIVNAVKEGRRIFDNIRKFVKYIMTCNGAELWTILLAPMMGLPLPLLPIHILWINLVTDGLPGLALATEKAEADIMSRPPRKSKESLFSDNLGMHIVWVGLLMAGITLGIQAWALNKGLEHWQTMVFSVLSFSQLGHVLAIRSDRTFLYKQGLFSNIPLITSIILTVVLQLLVIYLPFANELLKTQPLSFFELMICFGCSAVVFHAVELEKWIKVHRQKK